MSESEREEMKRIFLFMWEEIFFVLSLFDGSVYEMLSFCFEIKFLCWATLLNFCCELECWREFQGHFVVLFLLFAKYFFSYFMHDSSRLHFQIKTNISSRAFILSEEAKLSTFIEQPTPLILDNIVVFFIFSVIKLYKLFRVQRQNLFADIIFPIPRK